MIIAFIKILCFTKLLMISIILTVKVRVYSLNDDLKPAKRETVLTFIVSMFI